MAQQEPRSEKPGTFAFGDDLEHRIDAIAQVQTEIFDTLERINRDWFARARSEARLASELSLKLTAARSVPDTATACQEWLSQRMQMLADDGRRAFADSQKLMETGMRLFGNSHPIPTT